MVAAGTGELMVQCIDRDGTMEGYDIALLQQVVACSQVPVIAAAGAGHFLHLKEAFDTGADAHRAEQFLLKALRAHLTPDEAKEVLTASGWSETFNRDVLGIRSGHTLAAWAGATSWMGHQQATAS